MDHHTRMAVTLVLSLAVSSQNLRMAAAGEADIVTVGIRYVIGFLILNVLVGTAGRLVNGYLRHHEQRRTEARLDELRQAREAQAEADAAEAEAEDRRMQRTA